MEEAQELSEEVFLVETGKIIEHGPVPDLLRKFDGKVRAETTTPCNDCIRVSNTCIRYIQKDRVQEYVEKGFTVKSVNLDDLFISKGVDLES